MSTPYPRGGAAADEIDFRRVAICLWGGRWWIVASIAVFTLASTALAFYMTPVYRASTVLMPASSGRGAGGSAMGSTLGQLGGLASLAGINVGSTDSETEEALAVLRSRDFTASFINDEKLMPLLRTDGHSTAAKAYRYFDKKVRSVLQDKKTGLITLQIDWIDRSVAAEWANKLVQRLNAEMRARAIAKAGASVGFLEKELSSTSDVGTREAINHLIESQIKSRMLANVTLEYVFSVVDRATPPDADDPVKPLKVPMMVGGFLLGALIGIAGVLMRNAFATGLGDSAGSFSANRAIVTRHVGARASVREPVQ